MDKEETGMNVYGGRRCRKGNRGECAQPRHASNERENSESWQSALPYYIAEYNSRVDPFVCFDEGMKP